MATSRAELHVLPKPTSSAPLAVPLRQGAWMLSIAPRTLRKYASEGRLPSIKIGNRLLFAVADLEKFLADHRRT